MVPSSRSLCARRAARALVLGGLLVLGATAGCHFDDGDGSRAVTTRQTGDGVEYLSREIIIRVQPGLAASALSNALRKVGGRVIDEPGPLADLGYHRVRLERPTADDAISQLVGMSGIARAERSYIVHAFDAVPVIASRTPNDPRFGELWGMQKIGAPAAWDSGTGSASIVVAVSDTGIDYTHPDLAANAWTNAGEIPGNGIDDDGNGYIDDVHGYDFANGDADPMDDNGHGTHVSGTIGGVGNNGVGVAGVNWNVRIVGAKFLTSNGSGSLWAGAQTILYAAKVHARVVNASWGCLGPSCYASYMEDALKTLNDAGGLFMAAAGNSANDNDAYPSYPANYAVANVVAVAATDSNDALASFSDWGATRVHLAAPGVSILSSLPGGQYASWNGTSMATPHVTGAAALFLAARPDATVTEVKQKLMDTADRVSSLAGKVVSGGRLNVAKLIAAAGHPPAAPSGFDAQPGSRSDVVLSWQANTETDLAGYHLKWGTKSGLYTQTLDLGATAIGTRVTGLIHGTTYYFVLTAYSTTSLVSSGTVEKVVTARDATAPPQVVDLTASGVAGGAVLSELVDSSGAFAPYWAAENALDGTDETAWISPGRLAAEEEQLTTRLYMPSLIDAVELHPNLAYPQFFPVDFDIELSTDGETWSAVGGLRNAAAAAGERVTIAFPATLASEVRLHVLRSAQHQSGTFYASVAELTIHEASSAPDRLTLTFTAPGDDPGEGRATRYDVRRATAPLTEASFAGGTAVATGAPLPAGTPESVTVSGLGGETTYYFALHAIDEAGNVSPLSNVASATTLLIPPSTITDLTVVDAPVPPHPGMVTLAWTAPGSDGKAGQAARYDLRLSTTPLTAGGFAAATAVPGLPVPAPAGTPETFAVEGLTAGTTYYFALRAVDAQGAPGGVSNVARAAPASGDDHAPPAVVGDLTARLSNASVKVVARVDSVSSELSPQRAASALVDGDVSTAWMTTAAGQTVPAWVILDYGSVQPLVRFRANPSTLDLVGSYPQDFEIQTSVDKINWATMIHVEGLTGTFGAWNEWSAPVTFARYARLSVTKRGPATGAAVYVAMGELEAYALTPELDADLTWVAPGDDGYAGTAVRYDLRVAAAPITEATFAAATSVPTLSPLHGGLIEVLHLPALPAEATLYYALKAVDGSGNWSGLSNLASLTTPGVSPAPVTDLIVTAAGTTTLTVGFTASGDDGLAGRATAYELRYAKTPLSPQTWDTATVAPAPAPQAAGAKETVTVAGLDAATTYYVALKVVDDVGNRSPLSNVASGTTRDGTPPAQIRDLTASTIDPAQRPPVTLSVIDSTGSYSPDTAAANLLDANDSTLWISAGRTQVQAETVTFGLGGARTLGRLRMRAGTGYTDLFPVDFKVELQAVANGPWTTVVAESGFATTGGWEEWALGAVPATAARLTVTKTVTWNGKLYTALGDLELYEDPTDYGKLRLSWTATGDDGVTGTATGYEVRRAPQALTDATFPNAIPVAGAPTPHPAGYLERFDVAGLQPETTACFALRAVDEASNASPVSNSACATTPGMPPATVTDLKVTTVTAATATLTFTAPGADGAVGTAARYELRRSNGRISAANWDTATVVSDIGAPKVAGTTETVTVTGLTGLTTYRFALRAVDGAGNSSAPSNNAMGTTADDIPPARVTDLAAATNAAAGGSLTLGWTAPGDNGMTGQAQRYDVRVSPQPITDATFTSATPVTVGVPKAGGSHETATLTGLGAEQLYYVALRSIDASGNTSALSNLASARTRDEPPSGITDLAVIGGTGPGLQQATLVVQWTAPGDDATVGTAASYDLRYATAPITGATFATATASATAIAPAAAGTRQQYTLTGLSPGVKYYVAIKSTDDRGNVSALSNVATSTTPDEMAPGSIGDLTAARGSAAGTLTVTLTAPGDDGVTGTAQAYDLRFALNALDAGSFATGTPLATPAPSPGGTRQTFTVSGLPNETTVHLMLRARDDAGNLSPLSNDASATTPEVAPAAIGDLRIVGRGVGTLMLAWTATGDDARAGTAVEYDLRWATSALSDATFAAGTRVTVSPPAGAGVTEGATASGLPANKTIYFAIKARDDRGNWSSLSNVLSAATEDTLAPAGIADLAAATGSAAGTITLRFTAPGDDDTTGTATRYDLRRSTAPLTAATWDTATPVTSPPAPRAGGTLESATVTGLKGETRFHFAVRAVDEAGNTGPLSNDAAADTAPVAPAAIVDLTAGTTMSGSTATVTLTWTAPGDDGMEGQATAYDVRYATSPITAATFAAATVVAAPAPSVAGTAQTVGIPGLHESTTYYFAVKTVDDTQTWSTLSNVASVTVPDLTKPGAPASLAASTPDTKGKRLAPAKLTASSVLGPSWDVANAGDADPTSSWASAGTDIASTESLTLDLGTAASVDEVRLTADPQHLDLFPRDFALQTSADGATWKSVVTEESFAAPSSTPIVWGFPAESARYVRLQITDTAASFGKHYAIVADMDVFSASAGDGRAQLTWIAPGDDGFTGKSTSYQVFRATQAFSDATLGTAVQVPAPPLPLAAGTLQTMQVTGLRGETTYFWGVRAIDEAGNIGPLSAMASAKTNDVPPAAVRTLVATSLGTTSVRLDWTATGDDGTVGTAKSVAIRYLPDAISSPSFPGGTPVPNLPPPGASGTAQTVTVTGLTPGVSYHFALVATDAAGNASHLSNVAVATTTRLPDTAPPARITDLTASQPPAGGQSVLRGKTFRSSEQGPDFVAAAVADGDPATFWSSAPRTSTQEEWVQVEVPPNTSSDRVRLTPASGFADLFPPDVMVRVSPDGLAWTTVATRSGIAASEGVPVVITFAAAQLRFVEVRATRLAQQGSGLYYAALAEVEVLTASPPPGTVVASWTAPADDGPTGRAARYDLRVGTCPFNPATATAVTTSSPAAAGSPERVRVAGIPGGAACAAITATDDAGNVSALSNVATILVP